MEIVLKRIAKKNDYTIGRLYVLADGDVKHKVHSGKNAGDKCSFEHTFDMKLLSQDTYFCDTLEPTWRNLKGIKLSPEEENSKYSRVSGKVARKIPGHTEEDKRTVSRARKVQRFLSQSFSVAEQFTGMPGKYVPLKETLRGFRMILNGECDDIPESYFLFVGTIDEVFEKAKNQ